MNNSDEYDEPSLKKKIRERGLLLINVVHEYIINERS